MYAYIDESGHTGSNLLDADQPVYHSVGVMSLEDIDQKYEKLFSDYARKCGFEYLHAAEMGMSRLQRFLPILTKRIRRDTVRFFIGSIDKKWFIVCKLFDFLFDPIENRAAYEHVFNQWHLRQLMLINFACLIDEEVLSEIWGAIMEKNIDKSVAQFVAVLRKLHAKLPLHPDKRTKEICAETLNWAENNPTELGIRFKGKKQLLMHTPNVAMFVPLMQSIEIQSQYWKSPVRRIIHDRQAQFQSIFKDIHRMLGNASSEPIGLIGGPKYSLRSAHGSSFGVLSSSTSAGIQLADLVLWLRQREWRDGGPPPEVHEFLDRVNRHSEPKGIFDLSYDTSVRVARDAYREAMQIDFPERARLRAAGILSAMEESRLARIKQHEKGK